VIPPGTSLEDADNSAEFMIGVFPELRIASDVAFLVPSKKALRRIHTNCPIPGPLLPDMGARMQLCTIRRQNVVEVADAALRRVPHLLGSADNGASWKVKAAKLRACCVGDERTYRLTTIREIFSEKKPPEPLALPGDMFWDDEKEEKKA
jgi:hypothetical protein